MYSLQYFVTTYHIIVCGYFIFHVHITARCPDTTWRDGGAAYCYKQTTRALPSRDAAASACRRMHSQASLTNTTTDAERVNIGRLLGAQSGGFIELWVQGCGVPDSTKHPCVVLSNWPSSNANYRCFTKPCTYERPRGLCQADKDNSDSCVNAPCQNGATCTDGYNNYTCTCAAGVTGRNCETNIDECLSKPCLHGGTCKDLVNAFICACPPGYTGLLCQTEINECLGHPCQHGGNCTDLVNAFICACPPGYTGLLCQTEIPSVCESAPCLHGGYCKEGNGGYVCLCTSGYTGTHCQIDVNECHSDPCLHAGICDDRINGFVCKCGDGYTGLTCETNIDECQSQPCQHNGTCIDDVGFYTCACPELFTGSHCQTVNCMCASHIIVVVITTVTSLLIVEAVTAGVVFTCRRRSKSKRNTPDSIKESGSTNVDKRDSSNYEEMGPVYEMPTEPYSVIQESAQPKHSKDQHVCTNQADLSGL